MPFTLLIKPTVMSKSQIQVKYLKEGFAWPLLYIFHSDADCLWEHNGPYLVLLFGILLAQQTEHETQQ